jgi:hypothetical protein
MEHLRAALSGWKSRSRTWTKVRSCFSKLQKKTLTVSERHIQQEGKTFGWKLPNYSTVILHTLVTSLLKGGIPAAPSGTATLLRLSPSHLFYLRQLPVKSPSSGTPSSHGLTGGVYKVRERIHRAMADARLLAIPPSWSRVADSNPNWDRV